MSPSTGPKHSVWWKKEPRRTPSLIPGDQRGASRLGDRGSSFRDYLDPSGREGGHHLKVRVFRRTGEPCYVCGTEIRRVKVAGRSTHYCPKCQR